MSDPAFKSTFKVIIVGTCNVGKSSIARRLVDGTFSEDTTATQGAEFNSHRVSTPNGSVALQIWDTAGQERFRSIAKAYFKSAVGAVLVFDLTKRASFDDVETWLTDVRTLSCTNCYIILVGNKADIEDKREITAEEAREFAEKHGLEYLETSAATGQNIENTFTRLAVAVSEGVESGKIVVPRYDGVAIANPTQSTKKCC